METSPIHSPIAHSASTTPPALWNNIHDSYEGFGAQGAYGDILSQNNYDANGVFILPEFQNVNQAMNNDIERNDNDDSEHSSQTVESKSQAVEIGGARDIESTYDNVDHNDGACEMEIKDEMVDPIINKVGYNKNDEIDFNIEQLNDMENQTNDNNKSNKEQDQNQNNGDINGQVVQPGDVGMDNSGAPVASECVLNKIGVDNNYNNKQPRRQSQRLKKKNKTNKSKSKIVDNGSTINGESIRRESQRIKARGKRIDYKQFY